MESKGIVRLIDNTYTTNTADRGTVLSSRTNQAVYLSRLCIHNCSAKNMATFVCISENAITLLSTSIVSCRSTVEHDIFDCVLMKLFNGFGFNSSSNSAKTYGATMELGPAVDSIAYFNYALVVSNSGEDNICQRYQYGFGEIKFANFYVVRTTSTTGLFSYTETEPTFSSCTFLENTGGWGVIGSRMTFVDCTIDFADPAPENVAITGKGWARPEEVQFMATELCGGFEFSIRKKPIIVRSLFAAHFVVEP